MAFGFLKKIIGAPVKVIGGVVKKIAPVVKLAAPLLKPVIEAVVPSPVKMLVNAVKKIPLARNIVNRITKGHFMASNLQSKLKGVIEQAMAMQGKNGTDLAFGVGFLLQNLVGLIILAKDLERHELIDQATEAIDALIGTEPGALVGPNGSMVKLDIPFIDDEKFYDMMLAGIKTVLSKTTTEPVAPTPGEAG